MKYRPLITIVFLCLAFNVTSAFKVRCWLFCNEQTGIQNDYVSARDSCRKYSQLRIETDTANPELLDERTRRAKLVNLFSACMADKGWTVPDGKTKEASAPVPVPTPSAAEAQRLAPVPAPTVPPVAMAAPVSVPAQAITTQQDAAVEAAESRKKRGLARSTECAFARHAAAYSSVSAARAQACDLECAQKMKTSVAGELPAACPGDPSVTPD